MSAVLPVGLAGISALGRAEQVQMEVLWLSVWTKNVPPGGEAGGGKGTRGSPVGSPAIRCGAPPGEWVLSSSSSPEREQQLSGGAASNSRTMDK